MVILYLESPSFVRSFSHTLHETKRKFKVREAKRLMGLKVHRDGFKAADSLEWQNAVACLHAIEVNVNLMVQSKERGS